MPIRDLFVAQINTNTPPGFDLNPGTYEYSNFVFPSNLGASHLGHYMAININVPTGEGDKSAGRPYPGFNTTPLSDKSKVDQLRGAEGNTYTPGTTAGNIIDRVATVLNGALNSVGLPTAPIDRIAISNRHTRRIKDTVVLAMPQNNLIYLSENDFENIALAHYGISGLAGVVAAGVGAFNAAAGVGLYNVLNNVGKGISKASTLAGYPLNPRLEILFTGRRQRGFVFEILMSPVNEGEANAIQNIIRLLRFHSSPDISASSYFFVPPAEFDITFYKDGKENLNIPRINTCVLEKIEVDMAPTGSYSAFSTGHPVQTRLSLGFREVEILHKARITQGF
jgi:hypothetical protein